MTNALPAPCDVPHCTAMTSQTGDQNKTLAACILASSLAFVDGSALNVALPAIHDDLGSSASELQWVINAYLLPLSALLLLGGAAGDRFGRRRLFLIGTFGFGLASLFCVASRNAPMLLAARFVQGLAAAMLMPNSLALLGATFSGEARGRAIGAWAAAGAMAGAVGPMLGGWLVAVVGWRYIFLLNLPLAGGAFWLGWRYVAETRNDAAGPLDWLGASIATISLAAITWSLTILTAPDAGALGQALVVLGIGLLGIILFLGIERHRGAMALMPIALFGTSSFIGLTLLTFFLYAALGGLFVLLPYVLITARGYSAFAAGAALLPLPLLLGVLSRQIGGLSARVSPRLLLTAGPAIAAVGFALTVRVSGGGSYVEDVLPGIVLIGLGAAAAVAPLTNAVMASVDVLHVGTANGFNSAVARGGGMVATALVGSVLGASGSGISEAYTWAALAGAALAAMASLCAAVLLRSSEIRASEKEA